MADTREEMEKQKAFDTQALLAWYRENKRDLPWRKTKDPYRIWVSEIMLQQTRINAAIGYYERFINEVPDVFALAQLDPDRLKKLWQGLGYYNRAANLQKAAKIITEKHRGVFPCRYEEILALPGVGEYTAGAIASLAFDQKEPAIDGNVLRVFGRLWQEEREVNDTSYRRELKEYLKTVYPEEASDFTSALMELGETVCLANTMPGCSLCPLGENCLSRRQNTQMLYPRMPEKKKAREEDRTVVLLENGGEWAIGKREEKGLLAGYDEFINLEGHRSEKEISNLFQEFAVQSVQKAGSYRHLFSHIHWNCLVYILHVQKKAGDLRWLRPEEIRTEAALPSVFVYCVEIIEKQTE